VPSEFPVKEEPHRSSVPAEGVDEIGVKGEIAVVERPQLERSRLCAMDGQVEKGDIEKIDGSTVGGDEIEGFFGRCLCLGRGAKEEVDIGRHACLLQGRQGPCRLLEAQALFEGFEHTLVTRFEAELEHHAPGGLQGFAEIDIGEKRNEAGEAAPGDSKRAFGNPLHESRAESIVHEVNERRSVS